MVVGIRNAPDDDPEAVARGGEHPVRTLGEDLAVHSLHVSLPDSSVTAQEEVESEVGPAAVGSQWFEIYLP